MQLVHAADFLVVCSSHMPMQIGSIRPCVWPKFSVACLSEEAVSMKVQRSKGYDKPRRGGKEERSQKDIPTIFKHEKRESSEKTERKDKKEDKSGNNQGGESGKEKDQEEQEEAQNDP